MFPTVCTVIIAHALKSLLQFYKSTSAGFEGLNGAVCAFLGVKLEMLEEFQGVSLKQRITISHPIDMQMSYIIFSPLPFLPPMIRAQWQVTWANLLFFGFIRVKLKLTATRVSLIRKIRWFCVFDVFFRNYELLVTLVNICHYTEKLNQTHNSRSIIYRHTLLLFY